MLYCFYGNISFEKYFPKGYPLKVVDFEQHKNAQEMVNQVNDPGKVVLVINAYKLRIYYDYFISRVIANSKAPVVVLSELRFDFFREIKRVMATFISKVNQLTNPVIFTFPLEENEGMCVNRIFPEGFKDFSMFGAQFKGIVPFILNEDASNPITITTMALSKDVLFPDLKSYAVDLKRILDEVPKKEIK